MDLHVQQIKQEEARRHDEAIAKGFNIKVEKKLFNSSTPIIFTKYVDGLGKIKIAIFMRNNDLFVRIGRKTSRLGFTRGGSHVVGWAIAVAECDKFKIIADLCAYGNMVPVKRITKRDYYTKPAKRFKLDFYQIGTIKGIRKDLF